MSDSGSRKPVPEPDPDGRLAGWRWWWRHTPLFRAIARIRQRGFSTQVYLVALVIALIGPGLIFTGILLVRYAGTERARFEQDARETVRSIALSVDRDTAGLVSVLQTLATSPRLKDSEFEFRCPGTPRARRRRARYPPAPAGRTAGGQHRRPARRTPAAHRLALRSRTGFGRAKGDDLRLHQRHADRGRDLRPGGAGPE